MKLEELFEKWSLTGLKINAAFLEMEWKPKDEDKSAAWELYVELLTRVTTQSLRHDEGRELAALESVYSLFPTTRDILKRHGRGCVNFSKVSVVILNQVVRPFTSKWHRRVSIGALERQEDRLLFRAELDALQIKLIAYAHLLSEIAEVEDITQLEF